MRSDLLASRVAARYLRAWIDLDNHFDNVEVDLEKAIPKIKAALTLAERLVDGFGKYEKEAKEVRREAGDAIAEYADVLSGLDKKKFGPYLALTLKAKSDLVSTPWEAFLGWSHPLGEFSSKVMGEIPRKQRAYLTKNRQEPWLKPLIDQHAPSSKVRKTLDKSRELSDRFQKEFESGGEAVDDLLEFWDMNVPNTSVGGGSRNFNWTREEEALAWEYSRLHGDARREAQFITNRTTEESIAALPKKIARMVEILETLKKAVVKRLYGR